MSDGDMLKHYSAALDEIYRLRAALAYEARVIEAHLLYKTFPKGRRAMATAQVARMREAAAGNASEVYPINFYRTLEEAGLRPTLTRHAWENR